MQCDTEQVIELGWEDAQFYGFIWENEGKDLRLLLQHASKPISELLYTRTSDLRISLSFGPDPRSPHRRNPSREVARS